MDSELWAVEQDDGFGLWVWDITEIINVSGGAEAADDGVTGRSVKADGFGTVMVLPSNATAPFRANALPSSVAPVFIVIQELLALGLPERRVQVGVGVEPGILDRRAFQAVPMKGDFAPVLASEVTQETRAVESDLSQGRHSR